MKLELKHLAPYLPYKLRVLYHFENRMMNAGNGSSKNWIGITALLQRQNELCHLILHPLSEYCGKTTAGTVMKLLNCSMRVVHQIWDLDSNTLKLNDITLETYNVMCKNHIDFQGLIKEDLAIDINTLKIEP